MDLNTPVSGRQFAKMVGQSEGAVRKAVDRGSIVAGFTADKKYIPLIASNEWGKAILKEFLDSGNIKDLHGAAMDKLKKSAAKERKPSTKVRYRAADDVVKEIMENEDQDEGLDFFDSLEAAEDMEAWDQDEEIPDVIGKPEAERRTAILKAQMLQLALKEKKGQVVATDKIRTVLFTYGVEIRTACEGITNAVLDQVRAVDSRHEAKRIMDEYIHKMLEDLADIAARNL